MNAPCAPFPPFPPFPANPAVGQSFGSWVWNGQNWVPSQVQGLVINLVKFNSVADNGMYQPSPGLVYAIVEAVGGGGGGGGALGGIPAPNEGLPGWVCGAGGGSGGQYMRSSLPASLLMGGVMVTIGPGGAGGQGALGAGYAAGGNGRQGGTTSFGALVVAPGGWGGGSNVFNPAPGSGLQGTGLDPALGQGADPAIGPGDSPPPGTVQVIGVAQFGAYGNAGMSGGTNYYDPAEARSGQSIVYGGAGGPTYFSGTWASARQQVAGQNGRDGHLHGVGGGGGISAYQTTPTNGGMGADGVVLVTEYCTLPASGAGDCQPDCIPDCGPEWGPAPWWPGHGPWRR